MNNKSTHHHSIKNRYTHTEKNQLTLGLGANNFISRDQFLLHFSRTNEFEPTTVFHLLVYIYGTDWGGGRNAYVRVQLERICAMLPSF